MKYSTKKQTFPWLQVDKLKRSPQQRRERPNCSWLCCTYSKRPVTRTPQPVPRKRPVHSPEAGGQGDREGNTRKKEKTEKGNYKLKDKHSYFQGQSQPCIHISSHANKAAASEVMLTEHVYFKPRDKITQHVLGRKGQAQFNGI